MKISEILKHDSIISDNLNIEFVWAKDGNSQVKMGINERVMNPYQIVHGGAIFTLADSAAGAAAFSFNEAYVTMDSYINFISPGIGKELMAKAKTIYRGSDTCVIEVTVENDQEVLTAKATFTMFKINIDTF